MIPTREARTASVTEQVRHMQAKMKIREPLLHERLIAEMVGTFFLVLTVGVSVAGGGDMAPVAIGLMLGIQVYTFGSVSGGCLNPAVTLAVFLSRRGKISAQNAGLYVAAQCLGAIIAGWISFAVTDKTFCFHYELTHSYGASWCLETLFTMALCSTVLTAGTSKDSPNQYFGFAIGLTVTAGALASGGFDQGSFNPAVTIGMNIANYCNSNSVLNPSFGAWVLFILAPLLGGCMAAGTFYATHGGEYDEVPTDAPAPVQASV